MHLNVRLRAGARATAVREARFAIVQDKKGVVVRLTQEVVHAIEYEELSIVGSETFGRHGSD